MGVPWSWVPIAAGATKALSGEVTLTNTLERLFVSGVVEVDGGGAQAQEEVLAACPEALRFTLREADGAWARPRRLSLPKE